MSIWRIVARTLVEHGGPPHHGVDQRMQTWKPSTISLRKFYYFSLSNSSQQNQEIQLKPPLRRKRRAVVVVVKKTTNMLDIRSYSEGNSVLVHKFRI